MNFSFDDDACREPLDCGIWGRAWEPSPTTQRVHVGQPRSLCTPNEASPSPSRFSIPEPMRAGGNTSAPHAGGLLSPEDWKAALEEEIHDESILGEDASSPSNSDLGRRPQLRRRRVHMDAARQPPKGPLPQSTRVESAQTRRKGSKTRSLWSDEALKDAMKALDVDYTYGEVSKAFGIPRTTLRDHYLGKRTSRKMGGKGVLSKEEDDALCKYILGMAEIGLPLTPIQVQHKVAEITQERPTPFTNGIPGRSWLKWFLHRHPKISLRSPQSLDQKRARSLNPNTTRRFYENLSKLYEEHQYKECQIWNLDESGAMANKNGLARVLARRGAKGVQSIVLVLTCVNAAGHSLPNFYIFKGVRNTKIHTSLCEPEATQGLQKKGWMDTYNFSCWMDHFTFLKEKEGVLSSSMRHLIILDRHKSHVSLEVLEKARRKGVDMLSLPSHTSHGLQPLDVSCFGPFKHPF